MRGKRKAARSALLAPRTKQAGKVLLTKGLRDVMCQMKGDTLCKDVKRPDVWKERTGTQATISVVYQGNRVGHGEGG